MQDTVNKENRADYIQFTLPADFKVQFESHIPEEGETYGHSYRSVSISQNGGNPEYMKEILGSNALEKDFTDNKIVIIELPKSQIFETTALVIRAALKR